jgi:hypothetical protein
VSDLELGRNYQKGDTDGQVSLIQEWLCLNGFGIVIDGDFGPATDYAVREFQKVNRLQVDGIVGQDTFKCLIKPMTNALIPIAPDGKSLGQMVVAYAEQHFQQKPREVGGQNMGPWVRLYMNGNEGVKYPWCAGFVSFILRQVCQSLDKPQPIPYTFLCNDLAASAKANGMFLAENQVNKSQIQSQIKPGAIFLQRKKATTSNWEHTGIVICADTDVFHTIEGNTNNNGSREGYEVWQQTKNYINRDFILIDH